VIIDVQKTGRRGICLTSSGMWMKAEKFDFKAGYRQTKEI